VIAVLAVCCDESGAVWEVFVHEEMPLIVIIPLIPEVYTAWTVSLSLSNENELRVNKRLFERNVPLCWI
jgi:hypothetical protein